MILRVLGSSGSEGPGHNPPAFLVDDFLLMDAGTVSLSLDIEAQCHITHIFLTHAHLDHIKGIPFLVDNIAVRTEECGVTLLSGRDVLSVIKKNIFNNRIWPDFSVIPSRERPAMRFEPVSTRVPVVIGDYTIYVTRVSHSVPAYGFMIEDGVSGALVYTGDTGPTERIWNRMKDHVVKVLIIEASFPDEMMDLARMTGHLTPALLEMEVRKMPAVPERIFVTHLKPQFKETIEAQLSRLRDIDVHILTNDMTITF